MNSITVATFNIRNGRAFDGLHSWPFRKSCTSATINSLNADVLGLQEAFKWQINFLFKKLAKTNPNFQKNTQAIGLGRDGKHRGEHCPIFISSKLKLISHQTLWFSDNSPIETSTQKTKLKNARFPRIATIATIAIPNDPLQRIIQIINTHLDEKQSINRQGSIEQIINILNPEYSQIVMGDFNITPEDKTFEQFLNAGLTSALDPKISTCHSLKGEDHKKQIDYIMVSKHFQIKKAEVKKLTHKGKFPSDHWPVIAELTFKK